MWRRRSRARHDDLFDLFPDLPRPARRSVEAQRARVLDLVERAKERASRNRREQNAAAQRIRRQVALRRQAISRRRRRTE